MKNLMILVKMQLKEQLNFKRLEIENVSKFHILVSIVATIAKFVLVTALCVAFLLAAKYVGLFSLANLPVPTTVISLVFSVMLLLSIFSCVIGLTKSIYYARDNAVLLTLPALPIQVYLSKMIIFFIFELKRNFSFIVPLFIAYYATHGYGIGVYPWMLFCIVWISLLSVSLGALLSIPAMWIGNFFRQHRWLQISGIVAIVGMCVVSLFYGISLIPENIDLLAAWDTTYWEIQDFLNNYATKFAYVYDITLMMLGETHNLKVSFPIGKTALRFLFIFGSAIVLLIAGILIVKPLFYKMASTPFEYLKRKTRPKKNVVHKKRFSAVFYEYLVTFKNPNRMLSNVGVLISVPMLIFLLNKIFLAMNTREIGDFMVVAFNVLIILLVILNSNCYASSIFSRDGRSIYLIKTQPTKYSLLIISKLLPNTSFAVLSLIGTSVILVLTLHISILNIITLMLSILMTYIAHMLYCAELDLMNPQTELYATVGSSDSNPNETKATATAFIVAFLSAGAMFLLLMERVGVSVYFKFFGVALFAVAYRVWMFFTKIRLYYKEK